MAFRDPPLTSLDALDARRVPDDKLFTTFLDWARIRGLIVGYFLTIYHQTGPKQGVQTKIDRLPKTLSGEIRAVVNQYVEEYGEDYRIPSDHLTIVDDGKTYIYRTSISRIYDIDLGMLVFITKHRVRPFEIDRFVRFFEANVSIRKQAIASTQNPPFVDLALQDPIQLDNEVGETVVKAIEANHTLLLNRNDSQEGFKTAFSTGPAQWIIPESDPIIVGLSQCNTPIYVQNILDSEWIGSRISRRQTSVMHKLIKLSKCKSALIFDVKHDKQYFAIVVCLFARPHAVSMTEIAIANRLRESLADYYRLGFERHKAALASANAEEVERKSRQALLIADIMHDATDDLLAARNSLDNIKPRSELEKNELENAKKSLKHLQSTARLFRFLFTADRNHEISVEEAMSVGNDYFNNALISEIYGEIEFKYRRALDNHKINMTIEIPHRFRVNCMNISVVRAIDNCVKNSIRHLRDKTHVKREITLGARSALVDGVAVMELWVHDNGTGIEPEWLEKVQKPFISKSGGMGLGLAIVGTVCDIHNGSLHLTSEWGSWTHVALRFPQFSERRGRKR